MGYIFNFGWLYDLIKILVENFFKLGIDTRLGGSVHFFFYDLIKIIILLSFMIFIVTYIRSYFPLEKTKNIIEKYDGLTAHIMASLLGIVTPFCSCSSIPLFIGFVEAGIPIGVTFSFLITSPIVNEAAFAVLLGSFGWKIAVLYVATGVLVGIGGGVLIRVLKMENEVEEYVYKMKTGKGIIEKLNQRERLEYSISHVSEIVKKIWIFLIIGIGIGAFIHGWAPEEILSKYAGKDNPIAVAVAVIVGIPLYSNALGTIPIAEALINKGVGMGTALSFMMAVTALSLPELILLRKVIKPKLIKTFVIITGSAIILVGYIFNIIL